jgi:hypothetical protein
VADTFIKQFIIDFPSEVLGWNHDLDEDCQPTDRPPDGSVVDPS